MSVARLVANRVAELDHAIRPPGAVLGRGENCDIKVFGPTLSAVHCTFFASENGDFTLRDVSTNGTYLNGVKVGKDNVKPLQNGDVLRFSQSSRADVPEYRFEFLLPLLTLVPNKQPKPTRRRSCASPLSQGHDKVTSLPTFTASFSTKRGDQSGAARSLADLPRPLSAPRSKRQRTIVEEEEQSIAVKHGAHKSQRDSVGYVSSQAKRCFAFDTLFQAIGGGLVRADALTVGDHVVSADGSHVEVVSVVAHFDELVDFVTIFTAKTCLRVTATHRMMVRTSSGDQDIFADAVRIGDWLMCSCEVEQCLNVHHSRSRGSIVEIMFQDDAAVVAFPSIGLVSKGQAWPIPKTTLELKDIKVEEEEKEEHDLEEDEVAAASSSVATASKSRSRGGRRRTRYAKKKNSVRLPSPDFFGD